MSIETARSVLIRTMHMDAEGLFPSPIRDQMLALWPNNVLDWRNVLLLTAPGSYPADSMFVALPGLATAKPGTPYSPYMGNSLKRWKTRG